MTDGIETFANDAGGNDRLRLRGRLVPRPHVPSSAGPYYVYTFTDLTGLSRVPDNLDDWRSNDDPDPGGGLLNELTVAVTATAGSTTLTCNDALIGTTGGGIGTGSWPAVVKWADGTFSIVIVTGHSGNTSLTVREAPTVSQTGTLAPLHSSDLGQHLTRLGTEYYAYLVANRPLRDCVREGWLDFVSDRRPADLQTMWSLTATSQTGGTTIVNGIQRATVGIGALNIQQGVNGGHYILRPNSNPCGIVTGAHADGEGLVHAFDTKGRSARFEAFVIADEQDATTRSGSPVCKVRLKDADGTVVREIDVGQVLKRVTIDIFAPVTKGTIEVVHPGNGSDGASGVQEYEIGVFNATLWINDVDPSLPLVGAGETVVTVGDSWFTFYGGAFHEHLATYSRAGRVINSSMGGQKASWAVAQFDTIKALKPDMVLLHFSINDLNDAGGEFANNDERRTDWLLNLSKFASLAAAEGIKVAIMTPPVTASGSQAQSLQQWTPYLAQGYPVNPRPTILEAELADVDGWFNVNARDGDEVTVLGLPYRADLDRSTTLPFLPLHRDVDYALRGTVDLSSYDRSDAVVGTDTDMDGLSDGFNSTIAPANVNITESIVSSKQRISAEYTASYTSGSPDVRVALSGLTDGNEGLLIVEFEGSDANLDVGVLQYFETGGGRFVDNASGSITHTHDGSGNLLVMYRAVMGAGATSQLRFRFLDDTSSLPVTYQMTIKRAHVFDLTAADAALGLSLRNRTNQQIYDLVQF